MAADTFSIILIPGYKFTLSPAKSLEQLAGKVNPVSGQQCHQGGIMGY
jgi:hypothetical protein